MGRKRFAGNRQVRRLKRRVDIVRQACRDFGLGAMTLFKRAYNWHFKKFDKLEVHAAHSNYQKNRRKIPYWLRTFIDQLKEPGGRIRLATG